MEKNNQTNIVCGRHGLGVVTTIEIRWQQSAVYIYWLFFCEKYQPENYANIHKFQLVLSDTSSLGKTKEQFHHHHQKQSIQNDILSICFMLQHAWNSMPKS